MLSKRSRAYQARKAEIEAMGEDELIRAMVEEPTLIRRPIVVENDSHVVGARKADLEAFAAKSRDER